MKRIAIIHTVKPVLNTFDMRIREAMPDKELVIHNLFDDFLATDPSPDGVGYFTIDNKKRLLNDIFSAELTGADLIVTTCSTLTPVVAEIRPFVKVPIVAIDDAMSEAAVEKGSKIMVLATAKSTIPTTIARLRQAARAIKKEIVLDSTFNETAYHAMKRLDLKTHDDLVLEQARSIRDYDVIVLAQASMAHLEQEIEKITKTPTFSTPDRCVRQIKKILFS